MIDAQNISKAYGDVQALDDVSFKVAEGEIVGLLGPNGAGKTTAIKILTGYLQPDEGSVTIDGLDVLTHTLEVQSRIGYLPENAPLYPELSVQKYLLMMADLRQIPHERGIVFAPWPTFDPEVARADEVVIPVQVNGKLRGRVTVPADSSEDAIRDAALADPAVAAHLAGKSVVKVIVARGKLVSVVVR